MRAYEEAFDAMLSTREIGGWQRFTGRSIGAYLGLVPTEYSSGRCRVQGGLTKTGNGHARRLLVEAAWHHRKPYSPTEEPGGQQDWDQTHPLETSL